jgi:hypothetical protein
MMTTKQKLDALIDIEIEYLKSLCNYDKNEELYQIILNQFGYKDLKEDDIKKEYQMKFDVEEVV